MLSQAALFYLYLVSISVSFIVYVFSHQISKIRTLLGAMLVLVLLALKADAVICQFFSGVPTFWRQRGRSYVGSIEFGACQLKDELHVLDLCLCKIVFFFVANVLLVMAMAVLCIYLFIIFIFLVLVIVFIVYMFLIFLSKRECLL